MKLALLLLSLAALKGLAITENEAVYLALQKHPDVVVARLDLRQDSLTLASARADQKVMLNLEGNPLIEYHTGGKGSDLTLLSHQGASVSQSLPGGGEISVSGDRTGTRLPDSSDYSVTSAAALTFTQPLLNNAWGNGDVQYTIKIERRRLNISREETRRKILETLSEVRSAYWNWVLALKTVRIREGELALSENGLVQARVKLSAGQGIELDTLSAALEFLKAKERLLTAQFDEKNGRKKFALALGLSPDSLTLDPAMEVKLDPLPPAEKILSAGLAQNPNLNILQETERLLQIQREKAANRALPRLDLTAGLRDEHLRGGAFGSGDVTDPFVGLRFTYDVLARKPRLERRRLEVALSSNAVEKAFAAKSLTLELETLVEAWRLDSTRLTLQGLEVAIGERHFNQAEEAYRLGTITQLERLKAQTDLIAFKLDKLTAEINLKRVEIAVDQSTGLAFERFGIKWESP